MHTKKQPRCTLRITRIPQDMSLATLREQLHAHGNVTEWVAHRQKLVAYVTYATPEEASRALHAMREHPRLLFNFSSMSLNDS